MSGEMVLTKKKEKKANFMQTFFGLQFMRQCPMVLKMSSQII